MRKSRFSETQIMGILRQGKGGLAVADLCQLDGEGALADLNAAASVEASQRPKPSSSRLAQ